MKNYGINPQASFSMPFCKECAETLVLGHGGGIVTLGIDTYNMRISDEYSNTIIAQVTSTSSGGGKIIFYNENVLRRHGAEGGKSSCCVTDETSPTLATTHAGMKSIVRRLNPTECSRLMGFPDDYLKIDGASTPDSPQYKACGNSWGVDSAQWVMLRAEKVLREIGAVENGRAVKYATTCSGVEAQSLSVSRSPWEAQFFSEIEPFPCKVLAARYPSVPNLGDMTKVDATPFSIDVLSGGTPCQSFSTAGKRHGLGGSTDWNDTTTRSSLAFHWVRIGLDAKAPLLVRENVPGVYSSSGGKDFPWLIHFLNSHGFSVAWRTLDVQFTFSQDFPRAIPQRRRRCWLCAYKGDDWRVPVRILWERTSRLGMMTPDRVLNDGTVMERKGSGGVADFDLFGNDVNKAAFTKDSRADMIPFEEMPDWNSKASVFNFAKTCGSVGYCGKIFNGETDPDHISTNLRENIGNCGCSVGDFIVTMKTPEWTAGIQLRNGEECPSAFNGTVCGLSDVLEPMETEADFARLHKYFLSQRACEGILRRAKARGKELPDALENALKEQILMWKDGELGLANDEAEDVDADDDESGLGDADGGLADCGDGE